MKRRDILAAAGVGLAATALAGCKEEAKSAAAPQEGSSSQTFNWKMVTSWPKNFPGVGVGAERFAKLVDEMSNGRLKVKVYAAVNWYGPGSIRCSLSRHRRDGSWCAVLLER